MIYIDFSLARVAYGALPSRVWKLGDKGASVGESEGAVSIALSKFRLHRRV